MSTRATIFALGARRAVAIASLLPTAASPLLSTAPAAAWTPATQLAIGAEAASIAPPDLARQLERHQERFRQGLLVPFERAEPSSHVKNGDGSGRVDVAVVEAVETAIRAIESHRPFAEIVFELGVAAHFLADANNPLASSNEDSGEAAYADDYLRYVESAQDRYPVVVYLDGRDLRTPDEIPLLVAGSLERSRHLYPFIGREYERVGGVDGVRLFDDRSTAFGVGSLAFSHAVSDVAAMLRCVWLAAGGSDARSLGWTPPTPPTGLATGTRRSALDVAATE